MDGAVAVICDDCAADETKTLDDIRWVCDGGIFDVGRIPVEQLTGPHKHDARKHPELSGLT
jgi:hypothetical protein